MNSDRLKMIDLFSGAGGLSEGLSEAGFHSLFASEIVPVYAQTYQRNHPNTAVFTADIRELDANEVRDNLGVERGELDLIAGGPPCQGFSINAPVRTILDERNHLFKEYLRFVDAFAPRAVLIENVPGLVSFEHGATLHAILDALAELGYGADVRILGAPYYGVPQMRWRTIVLGVRGRSLPSGAYPEPIYHAPIRANFTSTFDGQSIIKAPSPEANANFVTVYEAIGDLPPLTSGEKGNSVKDYRCDAFCDYQLDGFIYKTYIEPRIPKLWYFSDYFSMPCRINLSEFASGTITGSLSAEEYKIAKALFELSGLQIADIQNENNFEAFKAQLEATSNAITDDMFEYWTTNQNLEIRFEIEHTSSGIRYLNIRIYNSKHRVTLPLKNRSKGFLWFFSFLVWFSKIQGNKNSKYILLLDEPGLSLHASAQNDLLRFIDEKLAPEYQVIYTTHSPFMIDSLKLNEVRTVYDTQNPKIGSVVSDAVEERDSDTLFPLQAALGYTIAQNLYVSPNNLLVEGISDLVYLNHFSTVLKEMGREGLSDDVTIVPVGGADKIATFISLMRGNELSTVCLLDTFTDQSAKTRLKKMVEQKIITEKKIIYYHSVLEQSFADIEDMFTKDEYVALYNGAFGASVKATDLEAEKPIMSQLKRMNGNKSFNHYAPANYMAKNIGTLTFSEETLNYFEKLFVEVNKKF